MLPAFLPGSRPCISDHHRRAVPQSADVDDGPPALHERRLHAPEQQRLPASDVTGSRPGQHGRRRRPAHRTRHDAQEGLRRTAAVTATTAAAAAAATAAAGAAG